MRTSLPIVSVAIPITSIAFILAIFAALPVNFGFTNSAVYFNLSVRAIQVLFVLGVLGGILTSLLALVGGRQKTVKRRERFIALAGLITSVVYGILVVIWLNLVVVT